MQDEQTGADAAILVRLAALLGPTAMLVDPHDRRRYASDQSGHDGEVPLTVLRPATVADLARAVAICAEAGVPMVPQGGRTGLSAGACAVAGSVVISTERLTGIIALDVEAMTITAFAGTPLQVLQEAARDHGLTYPVDLGARGSATLGGTIATNAGGLRVLRNGMTRQSVLGLEVVLPDGRILSRLGELVKDNAGLDLKHLFIGSEGALGIVTRAVMQLRPTLAGTATALLGVRDHAAGLACLSSARRTFPERVAAFEGMWPDYWDFVCDRARLAPSPLAGRHGFYVLVEVVGGDDESFETWLGTLLDARLVEDGVVARSLADTEALWRVREAVGEVDAAFGPHVNFDLGIAPGRLGMFCDTADRRLAELAGVTGTLKVGHVGDGNVHFLVGHDADPTVVETIERTLYGLVETFAGTVTAEHGVGRLKGNWLPCCRTPEELDLMRSLKDCLDPLHLMNPGVLVPAELT